MVRSSIREIREKVTKPDTEYSDLRRRPTAPVVTVDQRETDRQAERPRDREKPEDRPAVSLAASHGMLRLRMSLPLVAALGASIGAGTTWITSYITDLNDDKEDRAAAMTEIREVRKQFDEHELRIAEIVRTQTDETKRREVLMIRIAEMQLLEWKHLTDVIVALKNRKPVPDKKSDLIEAEARVETNLRDER